MESNTRVSYMVQGARNSKYHASQWMRYLRKGISEEKVVLTSEEVRRIIDSGELTMFQVITLKRAVQPGTATNKRVAALNQRTSLSMLQELKRKYKDALPRKREGDF